MDNTNNWILITVDPAPNQQGAPPQPAPTWINMEYMAMVHFGDGFAAISLSHGITIGTSTPAEVDQLKAWIESRRLR
jgi:hypothetical protein